MPLLANLFKDFSQSVDLQLSLLQPVCVSGLTNMFQERKVSLTTGTPTGVIPNLHLLSTEFSRASQISVPSKQA